MQSRQVKGSFFLTGNFYANKEFKPLIRGLKKDGHYLGAHSDKHLLYADWTRRDSLLVTEEEFRSDLEANYRKMKEFGVEKADARYFLPPYEWYNSRIAEWTAQMGLQLINFTPGMRTTTDYTYPEMGQAYKSSEEIYHSVFDREKADQHGLNGYIILVHIGTDPRRKDKFYLRLGEMIDQLRAIGYNLVSLDEL